MDTVYYVVSGVSTKEIFDSVKANGPTSEEELFGRFTAGLTESDSSYEIEGSGDGESCKLQSAVINLNFTVTLPQHSDLTSLSHSQLSRWQAFADAVAVHEQRHVDIETNGMEALKQGVESLPDSFSDCDALSARVASIWEAERLRIEQQQMDFHESEEQVSQRLRVPFEQQIDENALKLAEYQDELTLVSLEIEELKVQIDDIDESMRPYDAEIAAIQDQYPDLVLPSDTADEYERLLAEWKRLNDLRNGIIGDVNDLVQQHTRTIEEFNRLTQQTNQLIDELAWIP